MRYTDKQVFAGIEYIKCRLEKSGYSPDKWDGESQDGNWILYAMTVADGARCACCQEPILRNALKFLQTSCGWKQIQLDALNYAIEKAAEND